MRKFLLLLLAVASTAFLFACMGEDPVTGVDGPGSDSVAVRLDTVVIIRFDTLTDTVRRFDTLFQDKEIVRVVEVVKLDTVIRRDTLKVPEIRLIYKVDTVVVAGDTVFRNDTMVVLDTVVKWETVVRVDTVIRRDTLIRKDTLVLKDTVARVDTVLKRDTLRIIDTLYVLRDSLKATAPNPANGPATGEPGQAYSFSAGGSTCGMRGVEYRIAFGDGSFSAWGGGPFVKSWAADGTYDLRVQSRCIDNIEILSAWSQQHRIVIAGAPGERSVSGPIAVSQTWSKDTLYRIVGTAILADSAALTIQPGTRIVFEEGASLTVGLRFQAMGSREDSIYVQGGEIFLRWRGPGTLPTWNPDGSYRHGPRLAFCSMGNTFLTIHDDDKATNGYGAYIKNSRIKEYRSDEFFARNRGSYIDSCVLGGYRLWSGSSRLLRSYVGELKLDMSYDFEVTRCQLKQVTLGAGSYAIPTGAFHHNTVAEFNVSYSGHGPFRNNNIIGAGGERVINLSSAGTDFGGNYWGTATTSEMDLLGADANIPAIRDYYDTPSLGKIRYEGWLPGPVPEATPGWIP